MYAAMRGKRAGYTSLERPHGRASRRSLLTPRGLVAAIAFAAFTLALFLPGSFWPAVRSRFLPAMANTSFSFVPGFFEQSEPGTDPAPYDVYAEGASFGLISRDWSHFIEEVKRLQESAPSDQFKVLFLARHGQGFHNVGESKYGTPEWDRYWSLLNGDGELTWGPDANLTDLGKSQARHAHGAWRRELALGLPFPAKFLSSPFTRAADTLRITWAGLGWDAAGGGGGQREGAGLKVAPLIREHWRETIGEHTCDKRRTASYLRVEFPGFNLEDGFSEEDLLWKPDWRETNADEDRRLKGALDALFDDSPRSTCESPPPPLFLPFCWGGGPLAGGVHPFFSSALDVSITVHSGVISAVLRVIGHPAFPLQTGGMIPLLVRRKQR